MKSRLILLGLFLSCIAAMPALTAQDPKAGKDAKDAKDKKESTDITALVREMNSDKFASPPTEFRPGHVDAKPLDAKAIQKTANGFTIQLPSKAPIPTPTVYKGKIFVSGGFHSKEYYCFDAVTGKYEWGTTITKAYLPQENQEFFTQGLTLMEWLRQFVPAHVTDADEPFTRGFLGKMLFSGDDIQKKTNVLSGGEKVRCMVSRMMLQNPNLVILDQPTNHLDLESINALNIALQRYQGTVLLVTHDEDLIDEVATRIWHFEGNHLITDFKGAYAEYQSISV